MKKFITCFTLFLMANLAQGQIATGTFIDGELMLIKGANIASASITTGTTTADCAASAGNNDALLLAAAASQTIIIVITPAVGYEMTISEVTARLKLSGSAGLATVKVNGTDFAFSLVPLILTAPVTSDCLTSVLSTFAGNVGPTTAAVTITITVSGYSGSNRSLTFDDITIAGIAQILPVELSKFNVKKAEQSVMLSWATASETNNDHFEIQKSTNGTQFQTIGQVKGNGTTVTGATYSFEDKTPSVGVAYYRLKQVDADGKFEYSSVRSILFGKSKLTVFSTIAKERISLTVSDDQIVPYDIINLNGQTVLAGKAIGQHTIDISGLNSGMYFIRTEGGEVTRFVKE